MKNFNYLIAFLFSVISIQSSWGASISLPENSDQSDSYGTSVIRSRHPTNTFTKLSTNEEIRMLIPNDPCNETHYAASDEDTHIITLSYKEDTVFMISLLSHREDEYDSTSEQNNAEEEGNDEVDISGYCAEYTHGILDESAAKEFLYGWAGQTFADNLLDKRTVLELHSYFIESIDYSILLVVCGPHDQALQAKALKYAKSLKIHPWKREELFSNRKE